MPGSVITGGARTLIGKLSGALKSFKPLTWAGWRSRPRWTKPRSPIDLFEINEAFASVAVQSMRDLGISSHIVNVNGGVIAMGHPIGASGARIVLHLADELRRRGGTGAAGLCGGGQGDALIINVPI
jgi:hypothetical protein